MKKFKAEREEAEASRRKSIDSIKNTVHALFPAVHKARAARKAAVAKAASARAAWAAKVKSGGWKAAVEADKPPEATVWVNEPQGLFMLSCLGRGPKHFSWTLRGGELAAKMSLKWMWSIRCELLGGSVPDHLDLDDIVLVR